MPEPPPRREWDLPDLREAGVAAVLFLALLEALRALAPYADSVFRAFVAGRPDSFADGVTTHATFAVGVLLAVAAPLLQPRLLAPLPRWGRIVAPALAAAAARAALALADSGWSRFWAGVALLASLGLLLPAFFDHAARREAGGTVGVGLFGALLLDVGARAVNGSFDATLDPSVTLAGVAVAALLAATPLVLPRGPRERRRALPRPGTGHRALLLGVSLYLALELLLSGASAARWSGVAYPVAASATFAAVLAGAALHAWRAARQRFAWPAAFAPLAAVASLALPDAFGAVTLLLVALAGAAVVDAAAGAVTAEVRRAGGARPRFFTGALVAFALLAFAHARTFARAPEYLGLGTRPQLVVLGVAAALFVPGALLGREVRTRPEAAPRLSRAAVGAVAAVVLLAGAGVASAWAPRAEAAPDAPPDPFVVVSWNVHQGVTLEGLLDWGSIADELRAMDADVVAIQEMESGRLERAGADGSVYLARELGMHHAFAPTVGRSSGNAVLSRFPILEAETIELPSSFHPRSAVRARVDVGGGVLVDVYSLHLGFREADRAASGALLAAHVKAGGVPAIVAGDFNAFGGAAAGGGALEAIGMHRSQDLAEPSPPPTFTTRNPRRAIDFVYATDDFAFTSHAVPDVRVSDHFPVRAVLTWRAPLE